ncbi:MAG: hypothetical protein GY754_47245 [bacterium]|nr:hypothetical protein [bacterium]
MNIQEAVSRALIEVILFLEFSDEDSVHPDTSVEQMEHIASTLQKMDEKGIKNFLEVCSLMANEYKDDEEKSEFLLLIGENLGISEVRL